MQRRSRLVLLLVWCASSVVRVLVSQRARDASLVSLLVALCFRCIVVFAWRFAVLCSVVLGLFCFWFGAPLLLLGCWCCSVVEMPASPLFLWRCAFVVLWFLLGVLQSFAAAFSACFASVFGAPLLLLGCCCGSVVELPASPLSLLVALCFRCSVVFAWRFAVLCSVVLGLVLLLVWCASSVVRVLVSQRGRASSRASLLVALCFRCSEVFAWRFAVLCSVVLGLFCFWFGAPLLLLGCWCRSVVELPASPLFLWRCAFVVLWFLLGVLQSFVASFSACFASVLVRLFCC